MLMRIFIVLIIVMLLLVSSSFRAQTGNSIPPQVQEPPQGWYQQNSGTTTYLGSTCFINKDTGWASKYLSSLITIDGGNTWLTYNPKVQVQKIIGKFGYGYSSKGSNWIAITTDGGQTWDDYDTGFELAGNFYFSTPTHGFCTDFLNSHIARTTDGGKTWKSYDSLFVGEIKGFVSFDSMHAIAGSSDFPNPDVNHQQHPLIAGVFYTSNGGESWAFNTKVRINGVGVLPILSFDSLRTIWFAGGDGIVYKSYNSGYFFQESYNLGSATRDMAASDSNNITAVGNFGMIYRTFDAGKNWIKQKSGVTSDLLAVAIVDSSTGWAVGSGGIILHTSNAGYTWVRQYITLDSLKIQTYPEPFASSVHARYNLPTTVHVSVSIYDVTGKVVKHILTNELQSPGEHILEIEASNLSQGTYYLRIDTGNAVGLIKMTRIVF